MFNHGFQEDLLQHFHRDQSKGEQPVAPQILLLLLTLLTWVIFAFFQSLQTFPNQQDSLKIIKIQFAGMEALWKGYSVQITVPQKGLSP